MGTLEALSVLSNMVFEKLTISHTAEVFRLWSDSESVRFTNWTFTPTLEECLERTWKVVAYYAKESLHFGPFLIREAGNRFVGMIGADYMGHAPGVYDVWYIVCREERGRGVATRALGELIQRMRASGRVKRATADVVTVNTGSWKLLERSGFSRDTTVAGGFQKHESTLDLYKYSLEFSPTT